MPRAVNEHVLRRNDPETPCVGAVSGLARTGSGKVGIVKQRYDAERGWSAGVWLVVS